MGDLISRSRLLDSLHREDTRLIGGNHYIRLSAVEEKIRIAPTVDAVEVVHGRWILGVPITCSVCGKPAAEHDSPIAFWVSPYCPWCGAKMDGGAVDV